MPINPETSAQQGKAIGDGKDNIVLPSDFPPGVAIIVAEAILNSDESDERSREGTNALRQLLEQVR